MNTAHQKHKNVFVGQMDTDSDPGYVAQGDYVDALNIVNGYGGIMGSVTNPKGTTPVVRTTPSGNGVVIGAKEDKQTGSVYIFVYNTDGFHEILRWNAKTETVVTVATGSVLGFTQSWKISHAEVADGKILSWTDALTYGPGTIEGNPPRKINIDKALNFQKKATFELYAGRPGEGQFANGVTYTFRRLNGTTGATVTTVVFTSDGTYLNNPVGGLLWLKAQLEASALATRLTITACDGCKLEIAAKFNDEYYITTSSELVMPPINRYPITLELQHIDLIKVPPKCAPIPTYVKDSTVGTNNVQGGCFQFRTRYVYDDNEKSAWSDISYVALNTDVNGEVIKSLNAIDVDFSDTILSQEAWLTSIRFVEVAVREGNTGLFRLIDRFPVCEIGVVTQKIRFYNDKLLSVVPSDDTSIASEAQVLKDFDYVPLLSGTLALTADESGDNRLMLGANLEGYDCVGCVDLTITEEQDTIGCLVDIEGTVEIVNSVPFSTLPASPPDYRNYDLGGFVVYLEGTNYYAISDNPANGTGTGAFKIKGVPKGRYAIRVASYMCRFGDSLGNRFNLNNGLEWQRTSSPVVSMAGLTNGLLDISAASGTHTLASNITIQNAFASNLGIDTAYSEVYVLDNEGAVTTPADHLSALGVEGYPIKWRLNNAGAEPPGTPDEVTFTDHNGFAWYGTTNGDFNTPKMQAITDGIVAASPGVTLLGRDSWKSVEANTLTSDAVTDGAVSALPPLFFVFNTASAFWTKRKRLIHGRVVDSAGDGIEGALVGYERTGRTEMTGPSGDYTIAVFEIVGQLTPPFSFLNSRSGDQLYVSYLQDICWLYPPTVPSPEPLIAPFYVVLFPIFEVSDIVIALPTGFIPPTSHRHLKSGGIYKFGIQYEDYAGRHAGVCGEVDVRIPFHTERNVFSPFVNRFEIASQPPTWATRYKLMRSKDMFYQWYLQWVSDEVKYAKITSIREAPVFTTFGNGDSTHIFLRVNPPVDISTASDTVLFFFRQFTQNGYEPSSGDRVRFVLDEMGDLISTSEIVEVEIVGRYLDDDKYYVVIEDFNYTKEITPGWTIEFLTPRSATDKLFYSDGSCFAILNPGLTNRYHAGSIQNQTASLPAQGYVVGGDTYWRYQNFLFGDASGRRIYSEHFTISDYQDSACEDIGRASAVLMDEGQRFQYDLVRYSDAYVPQSKVNGLSSFDAFAYKRINRKWGIIKWLGFNSSVLVAICEYKTQPIYVGRGRVMDLQGQTSVGRSGDILNIADETVADAGTLNPESVVHEDGRIYFWDKYHGTFWQFAQNGAVQIFGKKKNEFLLTGRQRQRVADGQDFCPAGFDRELQLYLITFPQKTYGSGETTVMLPEKTIAYSPDKQGWVTRFSFAPEWYGRAGTNLLSFRSGGIHLHNRGTTNNFYAVQYKSSIKFALNPAMSSMKDWFSVRILSKLKWTAPLIEILPSFKFASGMFSRISANRWKNEEGQWYSDILRDYTDNSAKFVAIGDPVLREQTALLQGRLLKGEVMIMTIETENGALPQILKDTTVSFLPSLNTE